MMALGGVCNHQYIQRLLSRGWQRDQIDGVRVIAALLASSVAMVSAATRIETGLQVGDILVFRRDAHIATD
jgi:hypothetical protein